MIEKSTRGRSVTAQAQATLEQPSTVPVTFWSESDNDQTQMYRAGAYGLLAALLRASPAQEILQHVAELGEVTAETDELAVAMSMMGLASSHTDINSIDDEYHALFIGLGRGELVPYGSWYLTGFLMEQPLSQLRDDLLQLGFERSESVREPEDHIAALCEVMSLMISEAMEMPAYASNQSSQTDFFDKHIGTWAETFFKDLSEASTAVFYRSVGRFGSAFIQFEKQYLAMKV